MSRFAGAPTQDPAVAAQVDLQTQYMSLMLAEMRAIRIAIQTGTPKEETSVYYFDAALAASAPQLIVCRLPSGAPIGAVYLENNATIAIATAYAGSVPGGPILNVANPGKYRVFAVPDNVASICIVVPQNAGAGIIRVQITTDNWTPQQGASN